MTPEQQRALAIARARRRRAEAETSGDEVVYSGSVLPFSRQADGDVQFDSNAGILGALKRTFMLPGQVAAGEVDPLSDEGISRAGEMAAVVSPINPAVRAGSHMVPGPIQNMRQPRPKPPTAEELRAASSSGYDAVRNMDVDFSATAVRDWANQVQRDLEADGIIAELAPKAFRVLRKLQQAPDDPSAVAPIASLEAARRTFGNAGKDFNNPTDQLAARTIRERLDSFLEKPPAESVVAGSAPAASQTLRDARANYAAAKRSDTLTGIEDAAELRAAVANSGQNLDNSTRQRLASLLLNPRQSAGFNSGERAAIENVARGTRGRNLMRGAGNVLGGGGGMGMMLTGSIGGGAGAMAGGPVGAALGAAIPTIAGSALKGGAARLTQRGLRNVDEMTRRRSPLYEALLANAPLEPVNPIATSAMIRALLADQL